MRNIAVVGIAWRHAITQPYRNILSVLSLGLGIGMLAASVGLGLGVRQFVLTQLLQILPADMIEARAQALDLGFIKLPAGTALGAQLGAARLDEARLEALAALPRVAGVYPKRHLALPLGAEGGAQLLGRNLYADLFVTGLPEALVKGADCPKFVDLDVNAAGLADDAVIPLVIAPQLIALYNASVAPALGTPILTPQHLMGLRFDLLVGQSLLLGKHARQAARRYTAEIVGVSPFAAPLGGSIPWQYARQLWAKYKDADSAAEPGGSGQKAEPIDSIIVRAARAEDIVSVTDSLVEAGLAIDETAQKVRHVLWGGMCFLASGGALVLFLAASQTAYSLCVYVAQRRRQWAILQALGMTPRAVIGLIVLQAAAAGALSGLLGLALAYATGRSVDALVLSIWPVGMLSPQTLFTLPPLFCLASLAVAIAASILGALGPAIAVATRAVHAGLDD